MEECYRVVAGVAVVLGLLVVWVPRTAAHGEAAQDAFIRTRTVAFYDVQFSGTEIQRGEAVVITGKFFMLKDWPTGVDKPGLAFLTAAMPGPVMLVQERWINGVFTPGSVTLRQGEEYDFKLILQGRREGRYHVHPMVAVQGVGPLLGPGVWITIAGGGAVANPLMLRNGETINLETGLAPLLDRSAHPEALPLGRERGGGPDYDATRPMGCQRARRPDWGGDPGGVSHDQGLLPVHDSPSSDQGGHPLGSAARKFYADQARRGAL